VQSVTHFDETALNGCEYWQVKLLDLKTPKTYMVVPLALTQCNQCFTRRITAFWIEGSIFFPLFFCQPEIHEVLTSALYATSMYHNSTQSNADPRSPRVLAKNICRAPTAFLARSDSLKRLLPRSSSLSESIRTSSTGRTRPTRNLG
jgi:hypothetical protein